MGLSPIQFSKSRRHRPQKNGGEPASTMPDRGASGASRSDPCPVSAAVLTGWKVSALFSWRFSNAAIRHDGRQNR
jgi:hypothetical protein